jgi:hypothetical protein
VALSETVVTTNQVSAVSGVATSTTTFSPAAGAMVVVRIGWMYSSNTAGTITLKDSLGNSYTSVVQHQDGFDIGITAIFTFTYVSAPGTIHLVATNSSTGSADALISPTIITGQAASQAGQATLQYDSGTGAGSAAVSHAVTTTTVGSILYAVTVGGGAVALTAVSGTTSTSTWADGASGDFAGSGRITAVTVTPGSVTVGWTVAAATAFSLCALEILPSAGSTPIAQADKAGAVDKLLPAVTAPQADVAGAVDKLLPAVTAPQADVAGAVDAVVITAESFPVSDTAGAVDSLAVSAAVPQADVAGAVEAVALTVVPAGAADVAGAAELMAISTPATEADTAGAVDSMSVAVAAALGDVAGAADNTANTTPQPADVAGAVDVLAVSAATPAADVGAAVDKLAVTAEAFPVGDTAGAVDKLAVTASVPLADVAGAADVTANVTPQPADAAGAADKLTAAATAPQADAAGAVDSLAVSAAAPAADVGGAADSMVAGSVTAPQHDAGGAVDSMVIAAGGTSSFIGQFPGNVGNLLNPPGYPGGPSGAASITPSAVGNSWEIFVVSGTDYVTRLAQIPNSMLLNWQFVRQLDDLGSGTVVLSQDDPWWTSVTLPGGLPTETLLDEECLWQVYKDGTCRFEFLGETVTEQLVDPSEQRQVTITGPGTAAVLKWAMVAPQGFPDIVLKLDGVLDTFDEVDVNGNGVVDTNIWTTLSPSSHIYITPIPVIYNYPGGTGYALSTLYPSGSLTIEASPSTTFLGASPYDATNTLISAQVTPIGVSSSSTDASTPAAYGTGLNGSELTQFYIQSNFNPAYYAMFGLSATAFYVQTHGPSGTVTKVLPAYDPTNHAYWMITEQGGTPGGPGTFYFWTSSDGQTWTLQYQAVHTWDATDVTFFVSATYSVDSSQSAQISNLNTNVTTPSYQGQIYIGVPLMGVWLDQLGQAQGRGTVPFVTTTVSTAYDSLGFPWTDTQNVQAVNGTDLYSLLQSAAAVVNADYVMDPGFQLRVVQPETGVVGIGVDRSSYIVLHEGMDSASKQRVRARNLITTLLGGENGDGHEISAYSPTYAAQWGQREGWFQAAVQIDPASMAYATASTLAQNETEVLSWAFNLVPNLPGKTIFDNFDVGDWLGLERPDFSAVDAVRVVGIAVQVDSAGTETHELTFLSYIQWLAEQLTYLANKLGGAFVNSLGTSPVAPSKYGTGQVPTYYTPAASLASLADVHSVSAGSTMSNAPLVYNPATGNYQHAGTTDPVTGATLPVTVQSPSGSATISDTTVVVNTGNGSTVIGLQGDGTVTVTDGGGNSPAVPDAPSVIGIVQGLQVAWDGLLSGAAPLMNFQYVQVHIGTSAGFTPSSATLVGTLKTAGTMSVSGLTISATYYVKLVAVSTSGAVSLPTSAVSVAVVGLPTAALTGQLPASLLGNSAGSWALNPNPFFNGGDLTGWFVTNGSLAATASVPAGAPGSPPWCALVASTSVNCRISGSTSPFPTTPGQPYVMTAWVYNPSGSAVSVAIGFNWTSGTTTISCPPASWTALTTVQTCPGGVTSAYQVLGPNASGVTIYVTAAVAAGQVSGQLIAAQTVTANQIAANTITASQIAASTITAAQIAANTITASQIAAATITAAQIAANTITAAKIAAGTIVAGIVNGTTITGASIVADGSSGEFLAYAGTPAFGNLVLSVSPQSGTDLLGNPYPQGLGLFNSNTQYTTMFASSAGNLALGTGSAGGGGLELVTQSTTPNSQFSIFYADGNGSAAYRNGSSGWNGQLLNCRTDTSNISNTTAGYIPLTAAWSIPAGDAVLTTTYRLTCWGTGTATGGTLPGITFQGLLSGTADGTAVIAAANLSGGGATNYWKAELIVSVTAAGSGGTAQFTLTAAGGPGGSIGGATAGGTNGPAAFNTTVGNTLQIQGHWVSGATSVSLVCYGSMIERLGA